MTCINKKETDISFGIVMESEYGLFRQDVKDIFAIAVSEEFADKDEDIISDEDINKSLYACDSLVLNITLNHKKIGGIIVRIDEAGRHGVLEILYLYQEYHNRGLGQTVLEHIEDRFPKVRKWELITPYFEKRNIHFYVNKCGFHIVEFFNQHHSGGAACDSDEKHKGEYFRFVKVMNS